MRILGLLLGLAVVCSNANAAIILSIGTASSEVGTGNVSVDVFARSDANNSTLDFSAIFTLTQGGQFGSTAGTFGLDASYLGFGNINPAGSSFNGAADTGALSIEFNASQLIPASNTKVATLLINKAGLAAGTYAIIGSDLGTNPGLPAAGYQYEQGSFTLTVAAVPEPTSIALLSVAIGGVFGRRLLRSRKKLASIA